MSAITWHICYLSALLAHLFTIMKLAFIYVVNHRVLEISYTGVCSTSVICGDINLLPHFIFILFNVWFIHCHVPFL